MSAPPSAPARNANGATRFRGRSRKIPPTGFLNFCGAPLARCRRPESESRCRCPSGRATEIFRFLLRFYSISNLAGPARRGCPAPFASAVDRDPLAKASPSRLAESSLRLRPAVKKPRAALLFPAARPQGVPPTAISVGPAPLSRRAPGRTFPGEHACGPARSVLRVSPRRAKDNPLFCPRGTMGNEKKKNKKGHTK